MVRILTFKLNEKYSYNIVVFGFGGFVAVLILYIYLEYSGLGTWSDRLKVLVLDLVLLSITMYRLYIHRKIKNINNSLITFSKMIRIEDNKIFLPVNNIEKRVLQLYRYIYRGEYRSSISLGEIIGQNKYIDLSNEEPYLFHGRKALPSDPKKFRRPDSLTYIDYDGPSYIAKYNGMEYIIIVLYPRFPSIDRDVLRVSMENDYGEVHVKVRDNVLEFYTYYTGERSRKLVVELFKEIGTGYVGDTIKLLEINRKGSGEYRIELPVLKDIHVLVLPNDTWFFSNSEILIRDFTYVGELLDNDFVLGFKSMKMRLVLDIPRARDIVSKETISFS